MPPPAGGHQPPAQAPGKCLAQPAEGAVSATAAPSKPPSLFSAHLPCGLASAHTPSIAPLPVDPQTIPPTSTSCLLSPSILSGPQCALRHSSHPLSIPFQLLQAEPNPQPVASQALLLSAHPSCACLSFVSHILHCKCPVSWEGSRQGGGAAGAEGGLRALAAPGLGFGETGTHVQNRIDGTQVAALGGAGEESNKNRR